jgi:hypothetical protein
MGVEGVDGDFGCEFDHDDFDSGITVSFSSWNGREVNAVHPRAVQHSRFSFIYALVHGYSTRLGDSVACHRSFVSKLARKTRNIGRDVRHFAKKHKTALIITAAVVAVVVVAVLTAGSGTPAAAAKASATIAAVAAAEAGSAPRRREENESPPNTSTIGAQPINISPPSRPAGSEPLNVPTISYTPPLSVSSTAPSFLDSPSSASAQSITSHSTISSSSFTLPKTTSVSANQGPPSYTPWRPGETQLAQLNHPHASTLTAAPSMQGPKHVSQPAPLPSIVFTDPDSSVRAYDLPPREPTQPIPRVFEVPGRQLARGRIGGINGVGNSIGNTQGHGNYVSQNGGGFYVEWVHNRSHSLAVDIAEALCLNLPGFSGPAKDLAANWKKFHEEYKNDPDAKYLQFCHSQGTIHVKNTLLSLPEEIRNRIIVVAIAPAAIITDDLCFKSFNYASKGRDPIPFVEASLSAGLSEDYELRDKNQAALKQLILLEPHPDAPSFDHEFQSPTFKEIIEKHLKEFVKEYDEPQ